MPYSTSLDCLVYRLKSNDKTISSVGGMLDKMGLFSPSQDVRRSRDSVELF